MALPSGSHLPGVCADGVHPGIFRPPTKSPSSRTSSGYLPPRSTRANEDRPKRKHFHDDFSSKVRHLQTGDDAGSDGSSTPVTARRNYRLAGELNTPTGGFGEGSEILGESMYTDSDYRRKLGTKRPRDDVDFFTDSRPFMAQPLTPPKQSPSKGWGALATTALGGFLGRLWQFCTASSFKGFHAGGGSGYDLRPSAEDISMLQDDFNKESPHQHVPGGYPYLISETARRYSDVTYTRSTRSRPTTPSRPAVKRRQVEASDDLGKNWVMVGSPTSSPRRPGTPDSVAGRTSGGSIHMSPRNRNHAPSVTTGRRISTPAPRLSVPGRRSNASVASGASTSTATVAEARPTSSASYAPARSPSPTKMPVGSPSSSLPTPKAHPVRRHRPSFTGASGHSRTQSGASTASSRIPEDLDSSPRLDKEAKKLAARRRKEDNETDVRISAFNKQLQDMIRQGKEALGTSVEVDGGDSWEDDEL